MSPIEYGFNVYKAYLKRYAKDYEPHEWFLLHKQALDSVSVDTAIKEFRKCGIPFSYDVLTTDEIESLNLNV